MSVDTEQTRRDEFADDVLQRLIASNREYQMEHGYYIVPLAQRLLDTRAELKQAERERDEADEYGGRMQEECGTLRAQLAKVPALVEADQITDIDEWLDSSVADRYQRESLGQDWARVSKAAEEVGEAIEALIAWTGQNPRKPQRDEARSELLKELADVALTGIYGIQHFTKDADETLRIVRQRLARHHERMSVAYGQEEKT